MPLLKLEKAGLLSLVDKVIREIDAQISNCAEACNVEGQHQDYYTRVYRNLIYARGQLSGAEDIKAILEKYL